MAYGNAPSLARSPTMRTRRSEQPGGIEAVAVFGGVHVSGNRRTCRGESPSSIATCTVRVKRYLYSM